MKHPDVDIDFADRKSALRILAAVPAMIMRDGKAVLHPSGVYLQDVPIDPFTRMASLSHERLDQEGFFKIDLLNQSVYDDVKDEAHLEKLLSSEPLWELLDEPGMVEQLPHIHNHFDIVQEIAPRSIEDLAVVIALVRPGKRHLLGQPRAIIDAQIWELDADGTYAFKRSHAISYATLIGVKMNLLVEEMLSDAS